MFITNYQISMYRGDSETIKINLTNKADGSARPLESDESIYMTVRRTTESDEVVLSKIITKQDSPGVVLINLKPEDTANLPLGDYVYDIRIKRGTTWVKTIIGAEDPLRRWRAKFKLLSEVTK